MLRQWLSAAASDDPAVTRILIHMRGDSWLPEAWSCYGDCRRSVLRAGQGAVNFAPIIWRSYITWVLRADAGEPAIAAGSD